MIENSELMSYEDQLKGQLIMISEMKDIKNDVLAVKNEVSDMKKDIAKDVQELRDNIPLTRAEQREIQSTVQTKCNELTNDLFGKKVSDDLFLAKTGHFRIAVYSRLKQIFNVTTYYEIRRVDFTDAKRVIKNVRLDNLESYQKRLTARQKEIAILNNDPVEKLLDIA